MSRIADLLSIAIHHHQAGRLDLAEPIYREILAVDPKPADALHLLGVIASQRGQFASAVAYIQQALAHDNTQSGYYINLGNAQTALGNHEEAANAHRRAVALQPDLAEAHCSLGNSLKAQGKMNEAVASYNLALELKPDLAVAHSNLGAALKALGQLDDAIRCYERAVELMPNLVEAHRNLGNALAVQGRTDDAIDSFWTALQLKPNCPEICNNLGQVLLEKDEWEEATAYLRRAVELKPDYAEAHCNLGAAYRWQAKFAEAIACYRRALELKPDYVEAHSNLGNALCGLGRLDEAAASFERALQIKPDHVEARYCRSFLLLQKGDFEQGFLEHEWRWKTKKNPPRGFPGPQWDGQLLPAGSTLLLYAEQGFGDTFQFIRFVKLARETSGAANIVLECDRPLARIVASYRGFDRLVCRGDALPAFDAHASIHSLPWLLQTRIETIPRDGPYLFANSELIAHWHEKLAPIPGVRVGINWHGRENHPLAQCRDLPLSLLTELSRLPELSLVSLQKGVNQSDLAQSHDTKPIALLGDDMDTASGPFMDTAAIMINVDLVITSDTSVAHLAGALGAPVWVVLPYAADWRWFLDRSDSPWYPTMRLFRQKKPGDWAGAFAEINLALRAGLSTGSN
ncbi:MAG TPA: tetratricopeptide repeat protein [Pirellulaceae bacterium]|jgi:tetratricopeptide (TPR) repeat protein